ncbi:ATM interactor [Schistosoma japonicum]|uniref:ATM interactor n=1 Tax=Schistosoma japonicum TaxID=6182 RepID=A0A4Z2DN38_SCHJA|nr:ATM interactor [Schistosoma japonicum]KAH8865992.1 ATM interactor [Schistosoma japonicum]KAH8865994.1 ATM interactor [Schistosoma japonicum]KAH8865995.1 ATM interactor [Schistosoma japonicum]TNN17797.1 ATM interactor [Schistosoma japonicum]
MGTCEVYHSFASEPDINIDHNVSNFPATESSVCHLVISEPELTELPLPTYVCDLCGIKVKTKANLRAHQIKTHKIMKNAKDIAFYSKQRYNVSHIYHCPVTACKHNIALGGGFSTYWRLKQHYQHVHMQKSYQCDKCKHFFPTPSYHAYHQKLCGATYSCSVCFRSYSSKKHLLQHCRRSGHSETVPLNSLSKTKNPSNKSPSKYTSIPSSNVTCDSIPVSATYTPVILPLFILPVPVPNVIGVNVENTNSNVVDCFNVNFLYTSALSALRTLSAQICPNPNVQVNSSEPIINPSDGPVVFKPSLRNFPSFYTMSDTSLFSEASTQTEEAYTPMIVSQSYSQTHAFQTHELVSVNTCTDEDDISFFIGGLFCNASVEANFLQPNTINDNSEVKEEGNLLNETKQVTLGSIKERQSSLLGNPIENSVQMSDYTSLTGCLNSGVDQEIQARLLPLRENAAMQTDVVEKFNAEVATHCPHVDRSTYFTPSRMLETPPPPMLQSTVSLGTHLSTACQTFHGLLNDAKISEKQPSQTFNVNTTIDSSTHTSANLLNYSSYDLPTSTDSILRCSSSSIKTSAQNSTIPTSCNNSQYDSLNSIVTTTQHYWLPSMDFTHNETQTIDEDIELWLNSVETQTNLALFDPSFFSDICVGVDDNFFHS